MNKKVGAALEAPVSEAVPSTEEFLSSISPQMEAEIRKRIIEKDPDYPDEIVEEDTRKFLENEKNFCRKVIEAYERWSQEPEPAVVLWDVDETIGTQLRIRGAYVWRLRPSIVPLMEYLQDRFPGVKNGLLTGRWQLEKQLADPAILGSIGEFIDLQHLHSTYGVEPSEKVRGHFRGGKFWPDEEHLQKLTVLWGLRDQGVNVKVIDNHLVAETMDEDGVYVFKLGPRV